MAGSMKQATKLRPWTKVCEMTLVLPELRCAYLHDTSRIIGSNLLVTPSKTILELPRGGVMPIGRGVHRHKCDGDTGRHKCLPPYVAHLLRLSVGEPTKGAPTQDKDFLTLGLDVNGPLSDCSTGR
jgi:hypothetical protein